MGGFLEEKDRGQSFAEDLVIAEDGDHLISQDADFPGVPLFQVRQHQIEVLASVRQTFLECWQSLRSRPGDLLHGRLS